MNKIKQSGFTIVELLVVIVIIGILATIGFVTFANAQNRAKQSDAESTLAQAKSKLGEYYAQYNTYPQDEDALIEYLNDTNNSTVATKMANLGGTDRITYTATTATNTACTVTETRDVTTNELTAASGDCADFDLVADGDYWGSNTDKTVTP